MENQEGKYLPELLAEKDSLDVSFTHAMKLLSAGKKNKCHWQNFPVSFVQKDVYFMDCVKFFVVVVVVAMYVLKRTHLGWIVCTKRDGYSGL